RPAGQRAVAPADPRGARRRAARPRAVRAVPTPAPAARVRLLPAVVASLRREAGMELPPERRLRGPRRARVRAVRPREHEPRGPALRRALRRRLRPLRVARRPLPPDLARRAGPQGGEPRSGRGAPVQVILRRVPHRAVARLTRRSASYVTLGGHADPGRGRRAGRAAGGRARAAPRGL